jgi:hemerythrin
MDITHPKMILDVKTIPRVDIHFMNNTHFEEIEIVRKLGEQVHNFQGNHANTKSIENSISQLLEEWQKHTNAHFERENALMLETGFPAYPIHSNEHNNALQKMKIVIQRWNENKDIEQLADYIFHFWPNWFNEHVNTMDTITARFAIMKGYTEN